MHTRRVLFPAMLVLAIASSALTACSAASASQKPVLAMAALEGMPIEVKQAPVTVQQAYQFNVANPELMQQLPCYCGCGAIGHTSNYDCYVSNIEPDGRIDYDLHALGCSICVDISLDAMRMLEEGKALPEIKSTIDQTYAQYGPTNMP